MFFSSWDAVLRLFVVGVPAYLWLILLVRLTGKRSLSQLNAFDFVVTVALGSTLATTFVSRQVALVDGLLAITLLILLQFVVSWLSVRSSAVRDLMQSEASLVAYDGKPLDGPLREQRVSHEDLLAIVRESGAGSLDEVKAVILETNGRFAVIRRDEDRAGASALQSVQGLPSSR
jgi:uncharacterized membrane protein YcaP (DUF421 family)